jgi:hypothetical protein
VLPVGSREEDFSLVGRFLAEARPRRASGGTGHVNSLQEPKDALGGNKYDLVLFEDETEARPSLVGASPDKLNFFSAAYNELLALLSRDLRASDWLCA